MDARLPQASSAAPPVHLTQGSQRLLRCRYSKPVSPALDQKEADSFLMRGIVQNEECLVCMEMLRKIHGTISGRGSCLAISDSGFTQPLRNLSSFHHINTAAT